MAAATERTPPRRPPSPAEQAMARPNGVRHHSWRLAAREADYSIEAYQRLVLTP
jgi:hypothetical protein